MQELPGTLKVDMFAYAVEIKFLQGPTLSILGKFNFRFLLTHLLPNYLLK